MPFGIWAQPVLTAPSSRFQMIRPVGGIEGGDAARLARGDVEVALLAARGDVREVERLGRADAAQRTRPGQLQPLGVLDRELGGRGARLPRGAVAPGRPAGAAGDRRRGRSGRRERQDGGQDRERGRGAHARRVHGTSRHGRDDSASAPGTTPPPGRLPRMESADFDRRGVPRKALLDEGSGHRRHAGQPGPRRRRLPADRARDGAAPRRRRLRRARRAQAAPLHARWARPPRAASSRAIG